MKYSGRPLAERSTVGYQDEIAARKDDLACSTWLAAAFNVGLFTSAKSNASYTAINQAQEIVKKTGELTIPIALRNAPTKLMKELGYGNEYKYSHDYKNNFSSQKFMPDEIDGTKFYEPGNNLRENSQREYLKKRWKEKYNY